MKSNTTANLLSNSSIRRTATDLHSSAPVKFESSTTRKNVQYATNTTEIPTPTPKLSPSWSRKNLTVENLRSNKSRTDLKSWRN